MTRNSPLRSTPPGTTSASFMMRCVPGAAAGVHAGPLLGPVRIEREQREGREPVLPHVVARDVAEGAGQMGCDRGLSMRVQRVARRQVRDDAPPAPGAG